MKGTATDSIPMKGSWSEELIKLKSQLPDSIDEDLQYSNGRKDKIFEKLQRVKQHFLYMYNNINY